MKTAVIIPAAGQSSRMGVSKQLIPLGGMPVLAHTISAFENHEDIDEIVVIAPAGSTEELKSKVIFPFGFKKVIAVTEGGNNRQESVYAGLMLLDKISPNTDCVLIHDGARPLVGKQAISDVLSLVRLGLCAISGVKSKDTIKIADNRDNMVKSTPARDNLWIVQTPQGFPYHIIKEAHEAAGTDDFLGTDDAMLVERIGVPVYMVEGNYKNIKLTTPEDIEIAEVLITPPKI